MNERHEHFISEMREFSLLHEIDPTLASPKCEASHYNGCESSLSLEFDFADDTRSTNLEEVFDPPLTSCYCILF